jgi:hypothetical protein
MKTRFELGFVKGENIGVCEQVAPVFVRSGKQN